MPPKRTYIEPGKKLELDLTPVERNVKYPLCVEGERACPPEDCGGVPGYEHLLYVLHDPEDEEYDEMLEVVGQDFDPELFDARIATVRMVRGLRG